MNWQNYVARRRIDVAQWLIKESITTRENFLDKMRSLNIEPPDDATISLMFPQKTSENSAENEPELSSTPERIDTSSTRSVAPQGGEDGLRSGGDDGSKLRARGNKSVR